MSARLRTSVCILAALAVVCHICDARLRFKYNKRPECRDVWPRRLNELPETVLTGNIWSDFCLLSAIYHDLDVQASWKVSIRLLTAAAAITARWSTSSGFSGKLCVNRASHRRDPDQRRVCSGPNHLQDSRVTINGFGDPLVCRSHVKRFESYIFTLDNDADGSLHVNGTLHKINLHNLDRIKALTKGTPSTLHCARPGRKAAESKRHS